MKQSKIGILHFFFSLMYHTVFPMMQGYWATNVDPTSVITWLKFINKQGHKVISSRYSNIVRTLKLLSLSHEVFSGRIQKTGRYGCEKMYPSFLWKWSNLFGTVSAIWLVYMVKNVLSVPKKLAIKTDCILMPNIVQGLWYTAILIFF